MNTPVFYRPKNAYVGDAIPFVENGTAYLFFLLDERTEPKPGMPWALVTTKDYAHYEDHGVALASGGEDAKDFNCYTGSVLKDADGRHHLFYTGNNPKTTDESGRSIQLVMHATSDDGMRTWDRHDELSFGPCEGYEAYDWRDPFVFRDEEKGIWRMLFAARADHGADRRRGVTMQYVSEDLYHWTPTDPFWAPNRFVAMECPEVFQWGDWWYFVYSEFTDAFTTKYRMAKSLEGPWIAPDKDTIDGRAFYAAKSAFLNGKRYFTGWISTKKGEVDDGEWQWAGTMSTLEAVQNEDGTLGFRFPEALVGDFVNPVELDIPEASLSAPDSYVCSVSNQDAPHESTYIKATLDIAPGTHECGLLLRSSEDGDSSYAIRLEPHRSRMVFDRWPRKTTGGEQWQISGDVPFYVELERPCDLPAGEHTLEIIMEDSIAVVVLDGQVSLSTRMYDKLDGRVGYFVSDGAAAIVSLEARTR
ncbi:glycoside hydrolase [Bifidobacterium lemurum]|uniref:beta-fructofuranosidase n=1 Tax=Bifidobacterium lemurum TaxID=1603886 RepID=A0A261FRS2_9BIFI|nr:GH32 C-terminal domain-containing protein [Bifidobacterium lemurum]OZG61890.1 glycoside hydrolase [Bifidobacterium lemurum]QOL33316.1 family 43 glycosylhydrolase [Bifidobacterium lemurum]